MENEPLTYIDKFIIVASVPLFLIFIGTVISAILIGVQLGIDQSYYDASFDKYDIKTTVHLPEKYQEEFFKRQKELYGAVWIPYSIDKPTYFTLISVGEYND